MRASRHPLPGQSLGAQAEPPLSPRRAFVVQFREEMGTTQERFSGRVEHMTSGHATRFHSPEELMAFFSKILSNLHG